VACLDAAPAARQDGGMAMEIERKFLVADDGWRRQAGPGQPMRQGYLAGGKQVSVRVRVAGAQAWLNVKQAQSLTVRREYEYPIPLADARELLAHACESGVVEKTRYRVPHAGHVWEVDVFHGDNEGLVVAEVELASEDQPFECPAWLGRDVSAHARYLNHALARHPYREWAGSED
jgi:adenylate cyclase